MVTDNGGVVGAVPASGTTTSSVMMDCLGLRGSAAGLMPIATGHTPGSSEAHWSLMSVVEQMGSDIVSKPLGWRTLEGSSRNSATTLPANMSAGRSTRRRSARVCRMRAPELDTRPTAIATRSVGAASVILTVIEYFSPRCTYAVCSTTSMLGTVWASAARTTTSDGANVTTTANAALHHARGRKVTTCSCRSARPRARVRRARSPAARRARRRGSLLLGCSPKRGPHRRAAST